MACRSRQRGQDDPVPLSDLPPLPAHPYDTGELRAVLTEMFPGAPNEQRIRRLAALAGYSAGGARKLWFGERRVSLSVTFLVHQERRRLIYNRGKQTRRRR